MRLALEMCRSLEDQIEVAPLADDLGGQISHIPAADLTRAGRDLRHGRLGAGGRRLSTTAMAHLTVFAQNPVKA